MTLSVLFLLVALILAILAFLNVSASPRFSLGWGAFAFYLLAQVMGSGLIK